ncbi:MAG: hypothetical protein JWO96_264 [Candidatus Saccharibacteria bacterium]|nr:hypothetical protein [Candidatus Saccharibacteria bacterium]
MKAALKAELRKLLTVRSTYILTGIAVLIMAFVSFWIMGYKYSGHIDSNFLNYNALQAMPVISLFAVIVAILLMGHEYRHNTIFYTLTASNSRSKVLASKILAVLGYVLVLTIAATAINLLLMNYGHNLAGHPLPHQDLNLADVITKGLFYVVGFALAGLLFATLIRNLIFAIVFMLIVPNTVESLLTLLLKHKAVYLPFSALSQVIGTQGSNNGPLDMGHLSPGRGAAVFGAYLVVGWLITWILFLRRDAN